MGMHWSWAVVLLLLSPGAGGAQEAVAPEEEPASPATAGEDARWAHWLRMEATSLTLLPRRGVGGDEGFVQLEPRGLARRRGVFTLEV
ncbi:hypothetical protein D7Y23_12845, partial [Corallococcus sp. AB050B]